MGNRNGFTLVEIFIALAIVAIMIVIASSNLFAWLGHASAVDFQREVLARSNEARTRAMASNLQHRMVIDLGQETVALERGNLGAASTGWTPIGNGIAGTRGAGVQEIIVDGGAPVTANIHSFLYNPGGQVMYMDNSAAILPVTQALIHLTSENPVDRSTIRIFGWTSKARLENDWTN
ncbi:MAG: prepilin-type N-terminal cleavage/methylation domain-containing protein [Thermodesulfobacteriota bacterium]